MKRLILVLLLASSSMAYGYSVRVDGGIVSANKYLLNGQPVWDDDERAAILARAVNTGTGTITGGSFTAETVPPLDQSVIDDLAAEGTTVTASQARSEIDRRTARKFNLEQMVAYRNLIQTYVQGSSGTAIDVIASTQAFAVQYIKFRNRYTQAVR